MWFSSPFDSYFFMKRETSLPYLLDSLLTYLLIKWETGWVAHPAMETKSKIKYNNICSRCGLTMIKFMKERKGGLVCWDCKVKHQRQCTALWKKNHKLKVG